MKAENPEGPKGPDLVAQKIRERRQGLRLSLHELAKRAGIRSPSYVFHIERGDKVPSEEIAARIARALGEDEEFYRAWVRIRQRGPLEATILAARLYQRHLHRAGLPVEETFGTAEGESELGEPLFLAARETAGAIRPPEAGPHIARVASMGPQSPAPAALLRVPVLPEGTDPGTGRELACEPIETLRVDPKLVTVAEPLFRPFAYRLSEEGTRRVADTLRAGDLVFVTRNAWPLRAGEVYAVRRRGRVVLSRVRWRDEALWLLPADGGAELEAIEKSGTPPAALVGRVAVAIRSGS